MGSGKGKARRAKASVAASPALASQLVVRSNGTKEWHNKKHELHRVGGPACVTADGSKSWYLNGQLHRDDGPAVEDANGSKCWSEHGRWHRVDGPAVESADGREEWWLNGEEVDEITVRKAEEVNETAVRKAAALERLVDVELEPLKRVTF